MTWEGPAVALEKNNIHQGDCVDLLNQLSEGSVDLVFADPPFNIGYEYDVYDDTKPADDYIEWCHRWIKGVHRCLKPNGTFWLAIGDEYAAELKIEAQRAGFCCRSWVIWYYTFGVNCVNGFSRSHTHLFHFVKNPKDFSFNRSNPQVRVKSARQLVYADLRANPSGRLPDNTWITRPQDAPHSFSPNHDTWYFARVAGTFKEREGFHGCQMPEQLLARIIRVSSNPRDLVLDPFSGSGTTLCVAKKLGRQWLGFELSNEYVTYIQQRLRKTQVDDPLDGPKDPLRSAPSTDKGKRRKKKPLDRESEQAIITAYTKAAGGYSTDYLLCHKELSAKFVAECRALGVQGNPAALTRLLLQLRKAKKLPKSTKRQPRMTAKEMDSYSFASEVAWRLMAIEYGQTLENILCSPEFAAEFDRLAAEFGPADTSSFEFRWAALGIRKRSNNSRRIAAEKFSQWLRKNRKLPPRISIEKCCDSTYEVPGVYLVFSADNELYAGESENVRGRIEQILNNPNWLDLEPTAVSIVANDSSDKHAAAIGMGAAGKPVIKLPAAPTRYRVATQRKSRLTGPMPDGVRRCIAALHRGGAADYGDELRLRVVKSRWHHL